MPRSFCGGVVRGVRPSSVDSSWRVTFVSKQYNTGYRSNGRLDGIKKKQLKWRYTQSSNQAAFLLPLNYPIEYYVMVVFCLFALGKARK